VGSWKSKWRFAELTSVPMDGLNAADERLRMQARREA
jgi:hypothetical protein